MKICRICQTALGPPDYFADAPAMTSLSTMIEVETSVSVCRNCGHPQSPDLPNVQAFYDHDYRISLQSADHDQLYEMGVDGPIFRTHHQMKLLLDLDVPQGGKVLDFGAAKAVTLRSFMEHRNDIFPHVFDVSEDYRSHWDGWISADAQATYELPARWSDHFDLITAHFVIEHVADPVAVFRSLENCLAPSGQLFFTVPDPISNPGDFLVVDHLNHFVASSLWPYRLKQQAWKLFPYGKICSAVPMSSLHNVGHVNKPNTKLPLRILHLFYLMTGTTY